MKTLPKLYLTVCISFLVINSSCKKDEDYLAPATFDAVISGTVSNIDNSPVGNTDILVEFSFSECSEPVFVFGGVTENDSAGNFERRITHPAQKVVKCLKLTVFPAPGGPPENVTVIRDLNLSLKHFNPLETVKLDMRI